jgi:hypothetical protein
MDYFRPLPPRELEFDTDRPFGGLIQISGAPLRNAIAHLGK